MITLFSEPPRSATPRAANSLVRRRRAEEKTQAGSTRSCDDFFGHGENDDLLHWGARGNKSDQLQLEWGTVMCLNTFPIRHIES